MNTQVGDIDVEAVQQRLAETGSAVTRISLPAGFQPRQAEMAFIQTATEVEVFIDAHTRYSGGSVLWREIVSRPPVAGTARLVGATSTVREAAALIERLVAAAALDDVPVEEDEAHGLHNARGLHDMIKDARLRPVQAVGRDGELNVVITALLRAERPNVLLSGPSGVGKTTIARALAASIASGDVPQPLRSVAMYELSLGGIIESTFTIGDMERLIRQVIELPARPVIFVDELHQISRHELKPLADLLKPALASGSIRMISATTPTELRRIEDRAFLRRFVEVLVGEPSPEACLKMLEAKATELEKHHGIEMPEERFRESVMLSRRYLKRRSLPAGAVDLLDHGGAIQVSSGEPGKLLTADSLLNAATAQSGLSRAYVASGHDPAVIERGIAGMKTELVGQAEALDRLGKLLTARTLERSLAWKAELRDLAVRIDSRPLATVLEIGPTGVGKTETARLLADKLFEGRIVQLNGSDAGPEAPHGIATWVGSPPGYVGYNQGGILTDALRAHPACLILIDEVEKASPSAVQNVLLPLLGDGIVTDRNNGEALSAADCVVIATSNIQPRQDGGLARSQEQPDRDDVFMDLRRHLLPEIVGRFNGVLVFKGLSPANLLAVWDRQFDGFCSRLGLPRPAFDEAASAWLESRLRRCRSGARGVIDLFREAVVPLAPQWGPATVITSDGWQITNRG